MYAVIDHTSNALHIEHQKYTSIVNCKYIIWCDDISELRIVWRYVQTEWSLKVATSANENTSPDLIFMSPAILHRRNIRIGLA